MAEAGEARTQRATARIGKVLKEKWRLDQLLGVGGMAAVYAATHRNGNRVAIKILHAEFAANVEVNARFRREGYLVNKVEHPGVVAVHDDDVTEEGAAFLVMDLLEGESLEARRMRLGGVLPTEEVLRMAGQVLEVLAVAHDKGLVHRDLKPENLFQCPDGTVKLLDFGLARARELPTKMGVTQSGATTMGTPAFMSPEQARGKWDKVDAKSDVWAFGATMFALLTGRLVHETPNVQELLLAATMNPARSIASVAPHLPPKVVEVVDRALRYDPAERWPDARAMLAGVREAYRVVRSIAAPVQQSVPQRPALPFAPPGGQITARHRVPGTHSPWLLLATGALLAIGLGFVAIFTVRALLPETPASQPSASVAVTANPPAPATASAEPSASVEPEVTAEPTRSVPPPPKAKPAPQRPSAARPAARRRPGPQDKRP